MSRVTPPVTKLTQAVRNISNASAKATSRHHAYLPRSMKDLRTDCSGRDLGAASSKSDLSYDVTRSHSTYGGYRPAPSTAIPVFKPIPLMQGFRTSAPKPASLDASTIDFAFLPNLPEEVPMVNFANVRVPLLPDNYTPDRSANSAHAIEQLDTALPSPEISVVAAHPENVTVVSALTEVVDNAGLDMDLSFLTAGFGAPVEKVSQKSGQLKEFWDDIVDDIFSSSNRRIAM